MGLTEDDLKKIGEIVAAQLKPVKDELAKGTLGKRAEKIERNVDRLNDACQHYIIDTRKKLFRDALTARFRSTSSLVVAPAKDPPKTIVPPTAKAISELIAPKGQFVVEKIGRNSVYKIIPATFGPEDSRQLCAGVLQLKMDFFNKWGSGVFYDNPTLLRDARSRARKFLSLFATSGRIDNPSYKVVKAHNELHVNKVYVCDAIWVPEDENYWEEGFDIVAEGVRGCSSANSGDRPILNPEMAQLFVRSHGFAHYVGDEEIVVEMEADDSKS